MRLALPSRAYPRELRAVVEVGSTLTPGSRPRPPEGNGRTVLLVPGFLAPEQTLSPLARWLRSGGWRPVRPRIGLNTDCSQALVDRLATRLEQTSGSRGARAVVIGQSRGGVLGRVLAIQRPDVVDTAIGLGSPVVGPRSLKPQLQVMLAAVSGLGTLGVPGVVSRRCLDGECCQRYWAALTAAPNADVRLVSVWSHLDGVVDPDLCDDPYAESREVRSSHRGMGVNAAVWRELVSVLSAERS